MPYDANRSASDNAAVSPSPTNPAHRSNPFLQFVDPPAYRQLVERALSGTEAGRLITPLSRVRQRKGDSAGLGRAWDEELADDAA